MFPRKENFSSFGSGSTGSSSYASTSRNRNLNTFGTLLARDFENLDLNSRSNNNNISRAVRHATRGICADGSAGKRENETVVMVVEVDEDYDTEVEDSEPMTVLVHHDWIPFLIILIYLSLQIIFYTICCCRCCCFFFVTVVFNKSRRAYLSL